jgi:hypothetical protein
MDPNGEPRILGQHIGERQKNAGRRVAFDALAKGLQQYVG